MDADALDSWLAELERVLEDLAAAQARKANGLLAMDRDEIEASAEAEGRLAGRVHRLLRLDPVTDANDGDWPQVLENERRAVGAMGPTLRDQIKELDAAEFERIGNRLHSIHARAEAVFRKLSENWYVTYRMNEHVLEMLSILSGQDSAATESTDPSTQSEGAGLHLDDRA